MWYFIAQCIYLVLPGVVANSMPVMVRPYFKKLAKPLDGGRRFHGQPILGSHKTWRGLIFGVLGAIIMAGLQTYLYEHYDFFEALSLIPYGGKNFVLVGVVMGIGALGGDAVKSFIKRRVGVQPGAPFFPWDQLDSVIGGLVLLPIVYVPSWTAIITLVILSLVLHVIIRHIGYYVGINKEKW